MRIAIIGGSFDPVHLGHIAMARHVLSKHLVDEVWFMVAYVPPLKDRALTEFETRAAMVEKAIRYDRHMKVCTLEQNRKGTSYTIDTVLELKRSYPNHHFVWLIGNDQAKQLSSWKDIDALSKEIEFYVFPRNDEVITCDYPHMPMDMKLIDVSSSEIRQGRKWYYLPKTVKQSIQINGLYIEEIAKAHMSERRFLHSQSVANLCVELARCHKISIQKAYCAGILHDLCKEWGKDRLFQYLTYLDPDTLQEPAPIWHGYAGAYYIKQAYGIHDHDITNAIYHHVKGSMCSKLAMILYVSDKLDPSRGYDSSKTIALCKQDLIQGYETVKFQQECYLQKEK